MATQALSDRRAGLDVPLTNLSLAIAPDQTFIGNTLLPTIMRPTSTTTIATFGTEAFRIRYDKVGDYSEPDKLDVAIDKVTFEIDGHALMAPRSDRHQLESQRAGFGIDLDAELVYTLRASMDLERERAQAALITAPGSYGTNNKVDINAAANLWDNGANDPLDNIIDAIESVVPNASGRRPNVFWMGQEVWAGLMQNALVRQRIMGTTGPQPLPTTTQFASLIGVDRVLVGRSISRDESGAVTKIWGKNAGLVWVPPTAGNRIPAFGYTVEQSVFGGGSEAVVRFRDEKMGASGGEWIKRSAFYTPVLLFPDAGFLFYNAVA